MRGLGGGLLGRVADALEKLSAQKVAEHLHVVGHPCEPHWTEIGRIVFSWGCSPRRSRT